MKIERKNKIAAFGEIKDEIGICFDYKDTVFMITPVCYRNNKEVIAINLEDYELILDNEIKDNEQVTVLNLKLVEE